MRTGAPLWRAIAQKKLSYLKGFWMQDSGQRILLQHCPQMNLQVAQIRVDSDCSVDLFVMHVHVRSYSLFRMRVMVWMSPRQISCTSVQEEELCCTCAIAWITEGWSEWDHLVWNMSDIHPSSRSMALGEALVCLLCLASFSHTCCCFFCWMKGFPATHTYTHVKVRQLWV